MANTQLEKYRRIAKTLKNPTPVELPSGKFRCQVTVDGHRESIVDEDPRVAHAQAVAVKAKLLKAKKKPREITVGQAIDRYIESKDAVLSPATISGYKKIRKNDLQMIMDVSLSALTQEKVQRAVNTMSKDHSPKSVRNAHGLLSAALTEYYPEMVLRTTLPQKQRYDVAIPDSKDIDKIFEIVRDTTMELPVLLAVWLGLRASEIRGISWDCIDGNTLHIKQAIVEGEDGPVLKGTKTYSGDRSIRIPPYIQELIDKQPHVNEYVIQLSGQAMYKRFSRLCAKHGLPHYRFHDLRHVNASVMLAIGVPDKYAMERMGHATNNMLKTVYQHTMKSKQDEVADMVDSYFASKMHTNLHTGS